MSYRETKIKQKIDSNYYVAQLDLYEELFGNEFDADMIKAKNKDEVRKVRTKAIKHLTDKWNIEIKVIEK